MTQFPRLDHSTLLDRLRLPSGRCRAVLDTDTYNEIDDQFALIHALRSPGRIALEAVYAAPFLNHRSSSPGDGMNKSFDEIGRLLKLAVPSVPPPVLRGATAFLSDDKSPQATEASDDLIARAMSGRPQTLYVIAIGAITNIATALLIEPRLVERIVVVWLGGNALHWPHTREFNLFQDVAAAQVVLDSGVPLVLLPCRGVVDRLLTSIPELRDRLAGRGALAEYLVEIVTAYNREKHDVWSKVIWDIAATAWVTNPDWVPTDLLPCPILTREGTWSFDPSRHLIRIAREVRRDDIFRDVFHKIELPPEPR